MISQFISEDKIKEKCEILTNDPELIQKYNRIIEDNSPLFSTYAYDIGKHPNTGKDYRFNYRVRGEATPYISKFIPVNDLKRPAATEIVNKLTKHGIIKRMCFPWASALVWVSKAR